MKTILRIGAFVIGLLIVQFSLTHLNRRSRAESQRRICHMLRESIDRFTADTGASPKSAQDLVKARYLLDVRRDRSQRCVNANQAAIAFTLSDFVETSRPSTNGLPA